MTYLYDCKVPSMLCRYWASSVVPSKEKTEAADPATDADSQSPALDGGSELLGAAAPAKPDGSGEKFVVEGKAPAAAPGRADDFSWPPRRQPAAGATTETTTAISP